MVLNFSLPASRAAVAELGRRRVTFERYAGSPMGGEDGIFRGGGPLIAWFSDPGGHVLSVLRDA